MARTRESNRGTTALIIEVAFLVLAIMYLIFWKKRNIPVKMLAKVVIAQFLVAVILVKAPAGRHVVSKVSDAMTSITNCGQDGLDFVFGSLADSTAAAGPVFATQVLGNIVFLSALVSLLYYIGTLGFMVERIGRAVGKLMGTSEVESSVAAANMFPGRIDSPMPVGSIMMAEMLLPQTEEVWEAGSVRMDNKGNNTNVTGTVAEGTVTSMQMVLPIGTSLVTMVAPVATVNELSGVCGISLQQVFSYVFAPFGFFLSLDLSEILLEGSLLGSKLVLNGFVTFQQLGGMISSMDYGTGMIFAISLCGFTNLSSLGICVSDIVVLCPEKKSTLARLVFKATLGGMAASLVSAMTVGLVTLC